MVKYKKGGRGKKYFFPTKFHYFLLFLFFFFFQWKKLIRVEMEGGEGRGEVYKRKKETLKWTGLTEVTNGPVTLDRIMTSVMRNAIIAGKRQWNATTEILFIVSWGGGGVAFLSTTNRPSGNTCDSKIYRRAGFVAYTLYQFLYRHEHGGRERGK